MGFTAEQVKEMVSEFEEKNEDDDSYSVYDRLKREEEVEVPGLGKLIHTDSYGGEGQGDDYWVVFQAGDQYFRVNGYYASYDGGELDGEVEEVEPHEVTVTEWRRKG
jgi:hypothetical protein